MLLRQTNIERIGQPATHLYSIATNMLFILPTGHHFSQTGGPESKRR